MRPHFLSKKGGKTLLFKYEHEELSPFLFAIVMDELTRAIQDKIPWCMLFADDIVLVDETTAGVNVKLEL